MLINIRQIAEGKQILDAKICLCHNLGGAFNATPVTVLG